MRSDDGGRTVKVSPPLMGATSGGLREGTNGPTSQRYMN
jgi:hypothetical protein